MKSLIVENSDFEEDTTGYSELKVMHSAAGWYIGTTFTEDGMTMPGSRDSGYFGTEEEAQKHLEMVTRAANPQEFLRDGP